MAQKACLQIGNPLCHIWKLPDIFDMGITSLAKKHLDKNLDLFVLIISRNKFGLV